MNIDTSQALKTLQAMGNSFFRLLPHLVLALIVFLLFYFAAKGVRALVRRLNDRYRRHRNVGLVMGRLAQESSFSSGFWWLW